MRGRVGGRLASILGAAPVGVAASLAAAAVVAGRPLTAAPLQAAAALAAAPLVLASVAAAAAEPLADRPQRRRRGARIDAPSRDLSVQSSGQLGDPSAGSGVVRHTPE